MRTELLGNIAEQIDYGLTASARDDVGPKFLRITDLQDGRVDWSSVPGCNATGDVERYTLGVGDIVVARTGATTGKSYLIRDCPDGAVFASYLIRVRPGPQAHPPYLAKFFASAAYWRHITASSNGSAQPGVNASKLRELPVPLPPLPEQRRIAAILDEADALRRKRREALGLLDELLRSAFNEMFGDPVTNPRGWPTVDLGKLLVDGPTNGLYRPSSDYGTGTPIVRIDSFYDGAITDLSKLKRVAIESSVIERYALAAGQVLINRVNSPEHLGKAALVPDLNEPTVFESNMMRLTLDKEKVVPTFLVTQLLSPYLRRQIANSAKDAVNQSSINQHDVRSFKIRLPPLPMQRRWEAFVAAHRAQVAARHRQGDEADDLFNSLLHRAFAGEL
ncbi:MAG: hypothetical protein D6798_18385 [Deltaproteobacteria bacterium]|nr:MAG: hypothetical protein D6798_18385 [Deltaproteobacteria bacterium]